MAKRKSVNDEANNMTSAPNINNNYELLLDAEKKNVYWILLYYSSKSFAFNSLIQLFFVEIFSRNIDT